MSSRPCMLQLDLSVFTCLPTLLMIHIPEMSWYLARSHSLFRIFFSEKYIFNSRRNSKNIITGFAVFCHDNWTAKNQIWTYTYEFIYIYISLINMFIQNPASTSNGLNEQTHCVMKAIHGCVLVNLNVACSQLFKVCQTKIHAVVWCDNWYIFRGYILCWLLSQRTCSVTPSVKNSQQNSVSTQNEDKTSRGPIADNLYHHIFLHTTSDKNHTHQ